MKSARAIGDISADLSTLQPMLKKFPKAPSAISELYTVTDIQERFGLTWYAIYKAAEGGELHALRRHKRLFYAQWEVEALVRKRLKKVARLNTTATVVREPYALRDLNELTGTAGVPFARVA